MAQLILQVSTKQDRHKPRMRPDEACGIWASHNFDACIRILSKCQAGFGKAELLDALLTSPAKRIDHVQRHPTNVLELKKVTQMLDHLSANQGISPLSL
jgi:hypothetical protein